MKFPREKIFEPTKYLREKIFDPWNTYEEKFRSRKIPARKNFGPKKYPPENISDPRNTHIPQKNLDPQMHVGTMSWDTQDLKWHKTYGI